MNVAWCYGKAKCLTFLNRLSWLNTCYTLACDLSIYETKCLTVIYNDSWLFCNWRVDDVCICVVFYTGVID